MLFGSFVLRLGDDGRVFARKRRGRMAHRDRVFARRRRHDFQAFLAHGRPGGQQSAEA